MSFSVETAPADLSLVMDRIRLGRIASLRSVRSGREWLWSNPALPPRAAASYREPYGALNDVGGWDEVFPGVSEETVRWGREQMCVPDHGDLITLPWCESPLAQDGRFDRVAGSCRDFVFERKMEAVEGGWNLRYNLENRDTRPFPWLYCPHPLFAVEPGMTLTLADEAGVIIERTTIPEPKAADFQPVARKRFTERGRVSRVVLACPEGREQLWLSFDSSKLPFVGLWENYLGWHGAGDTPYFNLAIEPTTAPHDSLGDALVDGSARWLKPGQSCDWSLRLRLSSK